MALTSSMEDYLEAVFILQKQNGYVRCVDVAEQLRVKKPSVRQQSNSLGCCFFLSVFIPARQNLANVDFL